MHMYGTGAGYGVRRWCGSMVANMRDYHGWRRIAGYNTLAIVEDDHHIQLLFDCFMIA